MTDAIKAGDTVDVEKFNDPMLGGATANIQAGVFGDRYVTSFDGAVLSFRLNDESVQLLNEVLKTWYAAFTPAQEATRLLWLQHKKEKSQPPAGG